MTRNKKVYFKLKIYKIFLAVSRRPFAGEIEERG
jgi:hypothetical protein